jgi:hypothetical protein
MKRLLLAVLAVPMIAVLWPACGHVKSQDRQQREATYESVLNSYSRDLRLGLSRKEVEEYLRRKAITFTQMCCVEERSAFADLVKIGEEPHPWYCSENFINIAFEFRATEPHHPFIADDTDVLKTIRIFRQFGGCL